MPLCSPFSLTYSQPEQPLLFSVPMICFFQNVSRHSSDSARSFASGLFHSACAIDIYPYYYTYIPQFFYAFSSSWTLGMFPAIACYEQNCPRHSWTGLHVRVWDYLFWGIFPRVRLLGCMVNTCLIFKDCFPQLPYSFLKATYKGFSCLHLCSYFVLGVLSILPALGWYLRVVFICLSLMTNDSRRLFIGLWYSHIISKVFLINPFLIGLFSS